MKMNRSFFKAQSAAVLSCALIFTMLALMGCSSGESSESSAMSSSQGANDEVSSSSIEVSSEKNRDAKFEDIPADAVIAAEALHAMLERDDAPFVLDVRSAGLNHDASIEGAKNIPAGRQIDMRLNEIPRGEMVVIISSKTNRLAEVRQTLIDAGYDPAEIYVVGDGMEAWIAAGYPTGHIDSKGC